MTKEFLIDSFYPGFAQYVLLSFPPTAGYIKHKDIATGEVIF